MSKKINEKLKVLHSSLSGLNTKALDDGSVYFEGWANKAVVDRGRDLIGKKEWKLDNYKKNSIVLFNHDHSQPVGKMISVEARDEGLYVKGRISQSQDKAVARVRDLVSEGILNSLSVGIMVGDEEKSVDGSNILKNVELHEVSIVAVPMNQDSQFSLAAKALAVPVYAALTAVAEAAGHLEVVSALKHMEAINESLKDTDSLDYIADNLSEFAGIEKDVALAYLRLQTNETPAEVSTWIMKMDIGHTIKSLDEAGVQAISIPKDVAATKEEAIALAEGTNWATETVEETDSAWLLVQAPADQFEGEMRSIDLGNGLTAILGSKVAAAPDTAPAEPVVMDSTQAPEATASKGLLDDNGLTTPLEGNDASKIEVNPYLDQAKQTNILLGAVVSLLQQLMDKLAMMDQTEQAEVAMEVPVAEPGQLSAEDELTKSIEAFVKSTNARIDELIRK